MIEPQYLYPVLGLGLFLIGTGLKVFGFMVVWILGTELQGSYLCQFQVWQAVCHNINAVCLKLEYSLD